MPRQRRSSEKATISQREQGSDSTPSTPYDSTTASIPMIIPKPPPTSPSTSCHVSNKEAGSCLDAELEKAVQQLGADQNRFLIESLQLCPHLVEKESNPKLFLRYAQNDHAAAAQRLAEYWKTRKEAFGPERAWLPLRRYSLSMPPGNHEESPFSALKKSDFKLIDGGVIYLVRDEGGQAHIILNCAALPAVAESQKPAEYPGRQSIFRCLFYLFHTLCMNNADTNLLPSQPDLVVLLFGGQRWKLLQDALQMVLKMSRAMPIHPGHVRLVMPPGQPTSWGDLNVIIRTAEEQESLTPNKNKVSTHEGSSHEEILESLVSVGVYKSVVPSSWGGTYSASSKESLAALLPARTRGPTEADVSNGAAARVATTTNHHGARSPIDDRDAKITPRAGLQPSFSFDESTPTRRKRPLENEEKNDNGKSSSSVDIDTDSVDSESSRPTKQPTMNSIYSKRKRAKKKKQEQDLYFRKATLLEENHRLRQEEKALEALLTECQRKVELVEGRTRALHQVLPPLYRPTQVINVPHHPDLVNVSYPPAAVVPSALSTAAFLGGSTMDNVLQPTLFYQVVPSSMSLLNPGPFPWFHHKIGTAGIPANNAAFIPQPTVVSLNRAPDLLPLNVGSSATPVLHRAPAFPLGSAPTNRQQCLQQALLSGSYISPAAPGVILPPPSTQLAAMNPTLHDIFSWTRGTFPGLSRGVPSMTVAGPASFPFFGADPALANQSNPAQGTTRAAPGAASAAPPGSILQFLRRS